MVYYDCHYFDDWKHEAFFDGSSVAFYTVADCTAFARITDYDNMSFDVNISQGISKDTVSMFLKKFISPIEHVEDPEIRFHQHGVRCFKNLIRMTPLSVGDIPSNSFD